MPDPFAPTSMALQHLLQALRDRMYRFTTITPLSHQTVLQRSSTRGQPAAAQDLRDVFGWSMPFHPDVLDAELFGLMRASEVLRAAGQGLYRSAVRVSSLGDLLLLHSAFPTVEADSVFFGPDTYRFCDFVRRASHPSVDQVLDIGCGSGAGGLHLAMTQRAGSVRLTDINPRALMLAEVNARVAGVHAEVHHSDVLQQVGTLPPLCISNPPYMRDVAGRAYRDGGGALGEGLSIRIAREWLTRARTGDVLLLYTGAPVVRGEDLVLSGLHDLVHAIGGKLEYAELDPDVFGEELQTAGYVDVERIAAVGAEIRR